MSSFKEYLSCRPTEVPEDDVLLCESRYIETEKQMKKFKGLKRFPLSAKVVEDETYYFRSDAPLGGSWVTLASFWWMLAFEVTIL